MWTRNLLLLVAITGILFIANSPSVSASGYGGGGHNKGGGGGHGFVGGHNGGCPPGHWRNGRCAGPVVVVSQPVYVSRPVYVPQVHGGGHGGHGGGGHNKGYGRRLLKNGVVHPCYGHGANRRCGPVVAVPVYHPQVVSVYGKNHGGGYGNRGGNGHGHGGHGKGH